MTSLKQRLIEARLGEVLDALPDDTPLEVCNEVMADAVQHVFRAWLSTPDVATAVWDAFADESLGELRRRLAGVVMAAETKDEPEYDAWGAR